MRLWRIGALVLGGLGALALVLAASGTRTCSATPGASPRDGGLDVPELVVLRAEPSGATPLTPEMIQGVLPPRWHLGDEWEVMFCDYAGFNEDGPDNVATTRVLFRVVALPQPGVYSTAVEVQERVVLSNWSTGRSVTYERQAERGGGWHDVVPWRGQRIAFDGLTFEPIMEMIQTQAGWVVEDRRISERMRVSSILSYTPRVPPDLRNPEISVANFRVGRDRNTVTPTSEGLWFERLRDDPSRSKRVVFWRRGEPWWSYARIDYLREDPGTDLKTGFATSEERPGSWAVKLPPGEPDTFDCNSRR